MSEAIQDLVGRLATRLNEEAEAQVTESQAKHAAQLAQHQEAAAALKTEAQSSRRQLEQTQRILADEKASHDKANEDLRAKALECSQLAQQVTDQQERIAAEERHRQSLEEKHQHARQALEHFRQSVKEQRDQDQRQHEQQVQYLQSELRTLNQTLADKQHESTHAHQENARLLTELARAQSDLHQVQEEVRTLRPLKEELTFSRRHAEEVGRRLVEHQATAQKLDEQNAQLKTQADELSQRNQQLALELATAKASVLAQEQIVGNILQRFGDASSAKDVPESVSGREAETSSKENQKKLLKITS